MHSISYTIMKLRRDNNMSQEQLAEQLNVSRQAISKWERDESLPDINNLKSLSELFDVSLDYIVNGTEANVEKVEIEEVDNTSISSGPQEIYDEGIKDKSTIFLIVAVIIFIMCGVLFAWGNHSSRYWFILIGLFVSIGVGLTMYSSHLKHKFNRINGIKKKYEDEDDEEESVKDMSSGLLFVRTILPPIQTIIFLGIGFIYGVWHPTWMIFLLSPIILKTWGFVEDILELKKNK